MFSIDLEIQLIGLILEISGTFFFAKSVFLSDGEIKKLSFQELGGFLPSKQKELKEDRQVGRIGLAILLIGLILQGIGMLFSS